MDEQLPTLPPEPDEGELDEFRPARRPLGRRRRRSRGWRWALGLLLLAAAFVGGLALGRALEQSPKSGGTVTQVRTLVPETIGPARIVTVTARSG